MLIKRHDKVNKCGFSLEDMRSAGVECIYKKEDAPDPLISAIYDFRSRPDVLTPLAMGKEKFLAHLIKHQPKTGNALISGSELFSAFKTRVRPPLRAGMAPSVVGGLYVETYGRIIELGAMPFERKSRETSMIFGLPERIQRAYYLDGHIQGMGLPSDPSHLLRAYFLPT